jgi:hypothetical protein
MIFVTLIFFLSICQLKNTQKKTLAFSHFGKEVLPYCENLPGKKKELVTAAFHIHRWCHGTKVTFNVCLSER